MIKTLGDLKKMFPHWKNIFVARDKDGSLAVFDHEPYQLNGYWLSSNGFSQGINKNDFLEIKNGEVKNV